MDARREEKGKDDAMGPGREGGRERGPGREGGREGGRKERMSESEVDIESGCACALV
jgi:hypothetical protein